MKNLLIALILTLPLLGLAQNKQAPATTLKPLLDLYYDIKNALVSSDGNDASLKAAAFVKELNTIDEKSLSAPELKVYKTLKEKLAFDAEHISETKDVAHQRDHFSSFSNNMFTLVKSAKPTTEPVYQMYCPMKKTYWLSKEQAVKNPYYGKEMLTCGKVKTTL